MWALSEKWAGIPRNSTGATPGDSSVSASGGLDPEPHRATQPASTVLTPGQDHLRQIKHLLLGLLLFLFLLLLLGGPQQRQLLGVTNTWGGTGLRNWGPSGLGLRNQGV